MFFRANLERGEESFHFLCSFFILSSIMFADRIDLTALKLKLQIQIPLYYTITKLNYAHHYIAYGPQVPSI